MAPMKKYYLTIFLVCLFTQNINSLTACELNTEDLDSNFSAVHAGAFNNEIYVAIGSRNKYLTSEDGKIWEEHEFSLNRKILLRDIIWADKQFFSVGWNGIIISSDDGLSWETQRNSDNHNHQIFSMNEKITGIFYNNNNYYSISDYGILYSKNGIDWDYVLKPEEGFSMFFYDISGSTKRLIASGWNSWFSEDGQNWEKFDYPLNVGSLLWDGSRFISVHLNTLRESTNGDVWNDLYFGRFDLKLNAITSNGDSYVSVGDCGSILYGANKNNWKEVVSGTNINLVDVIWAGNKFLAFGYTQEYLYQREKKIVRDSSVTIQRQGKFAELRGIILYSNDGKNWAKALNINKKND